MPEWITIAPNIEYLPAGRQPLSADVGLVRGERFNWLFDVGDSPKAAEAIASIGGEANVVLSHFHKDHTGNLGKIACANIYCGAYTAKKLQTGIAVKAPLTVVDGAELLLFPLPSSHAKGCVGLAVGDYAFVGDAVYPAEKGGRTVYNVSLLSETIACLKSLPAKYLLVSHAAGLVREKREVVSALEKIRAAREAGQAYIEPCGYAAGLL